MTITNLIIIISVIIFVIINFGDKSGDKTTLAIKYGALYPPKIFIKKEYWRFLTANFVHIDIAHIFMNCYAIYYLGQFFESFLGMPAYLYLVLVSALATTMITYYYGQYTHSHENTVTLGASGIFYGFLGAMVALGVILQGPFMNLLRSYLYVIVINVAFTLFNSRISKTGHLGGFIGGFIAMAILIVSGICVY